MEEDILVELSDSEVVELANMYKSHKNELPYLDSFLQNCIKSKRNGMSHFVTIFSPRNCWREDGTFIASMPKHGHDVIFHTLDPSGKNLFEGLINTRRFKFLKNPERNFTWFYAIHELFYSKLREILTEVLHHELMEVVKVNFMCLRKEKAVKLNLAPPNHVYVKELEPADIPVLNSAWPFRSASSELKILDWITLTKGFGVYLKSNNQLVSWVSSSAFGQLAALQTLEEHKKKGYASLAIIAMARYLAENGYDSCGTVLVGNTASEALFKKLGFEKLFKAEYIKVHNKY